MPSHYTLTADSSRLRRLPWIDEVRTAHAPIYDIMPGRHAPVVYKKRRGGLVLTRMRWGLVPSWAEDPEVGYRLATIEIDEADSTPAFQSAFRARRCLLPADGFFSWKTIEDGAPRLFWFHRPEGEVFAIAGIWESWFSRETGFSLRTFAMMTESRRTAEAPGESPWPVIVDEECRKSWMTLRTGTRDLEAMFAGSKRESFVARPVSPEVLLRGDGGPETIRRL